MKKFIIILVLINLFSLGALASGDITQDMQEQIGFEDIKDALPNNSGLENFSLTDDIDILGSFTEIVNIDKALNSGIAKSTLMLLTKILVLVIIASVSLAFIDNNSVPVYIVNMAVVLAIITLVIGDFKGQILIGRDILEQIDVFSKVLMPALATAIAMSGQSIGAFSIGSLVSLSVFIGFIKSFLLPMTFTYLAVITAHACTNNDMLGRIHSIIKSLILNSLKLFLTVFVAFNSITSIIGSSVSSAFVKTAKFAVSGSVPLVGSIISDATDAFLSSAILIKNSIGVFGLLGILAICFVPFLRSFLNYIIFKIGASLIATMSNSVIVKLLDGICDAFNMILAMIISAAGALFFQIVIVIIFMRGG